MNKRKRMEEVVELPMEKKSKMKTWQDMEILTPCLCVFQGCIPLQGCQVNEHIANPDEPGRHLFEIVPGKLSLNSDTFLRSDFQKGDAAINKCTAVTVMLSSTPTL